VVLLQRGRLKVGVTDRLDLLLKLHRVLLGSSFADSKAVRERPGG
jgi:hypothetical protein